MAKALNSSHLCSKLPPHLSLPLSYNCFILGPLTFQALGHCPRSPSSASNALPSLQLVIGSTYSLFFRSYLNYFPLWMFLPGHMPKGQPIPGRSPSSYSMVPTAVVTVCVGLCVCLSYGLSLFPLECGVSERTHHIFLVHSWILGPKPAMAHSRCSQKSGKGKRRWPLNSILKNE